MDPLFEPDMEDGREIQKTEASCPIIEAALLLSIELSEGARDEARRALSDSIYGRNYDQVEVLKTAKEVVRRYR